MGGDGQLSGKNWGMRMMERDIKHRDTYVPSTYVLTGSGESGDQLKGSVSPLQTI